MLSLRKWLQPADGMQRGNFESGRQNSQNLWKKPDFGRKSRKSRILLSSYRSGQVLRLSHISPDHERVFGPLFEAKNGPFFGFFEGFHHFPQFSAKLEKKCSKSPKTKNFQFLLKKTSENFFFQTKNIFLKKQNIKYFKNLYDDKIVI